MCVFKTQNAQMEESGMAARSQEGYCRSQGCLTDRSHMTDMSDIRAEECSTHTYTHHRRGAQARHHLLLRQISVPDSCRQHGGGGVF